MLNYTEITTLTTAVANAIAANVPKEQLQLVSAIVTQVGDTLTIIAEVNDFNDSLSEKK